MRKLALAICLSTAFFSNAFGQDTFSSESPSYSQVQVGARFRSDYYFMGRSDSLPSPYFTPSIAWNHASGFFMRGTVSFLTAPQEALRADMVSIASGFDWEKGNFSTGISISQMFFSSESYAVQSEMSTYLNAYAGLDWKGFMVITDLGIGFSDRTDLFLGLELNRPIYLLRSKLRISPALLMNIGSQYYYQSYLIARSSQTKTSKGKGGGSGSGAGTVVVEEENARFQLLNYEAELRVSLRQGRFRHSVAGNYLIPVNAATYIVDGLQVKEPLSTGFFWSIGTTYQLWRSDW